MTYVAMDKREMIRVHTLVNKIIHNKTKRLSKKNSTNNYYTLTTR